MNALVTTLEFPEKAMRLPYVPQLADSFGIDNVRWKVLTDAIFPNAKETDSILMALTYCRARNLDIFKRPVHIVPMYSTVLGKMVDTIWPSIAELRTTAARTGQYAGKDETVFGPDKTQKLGNSEVTFPEWAQTTVYRMVGGVRCPFVGPRCYWTEYYATTKRDVKDPNDRWKRAVHGQIEKCAEAGALRMAFPEEIGNEYAAEEMEGQVILTEAADRAPAKRIPPPATRAPQIEARPESPAPAAPEAPRAPRRPPPAQRPAADANALAERAKAANTFPPKEAHVAARGFDELALIESYRDAAMGASDDDELDASWKKLIKPVYAQMTPQGQHEVQQIDDTCRGANA